jgi:hypothetical protein
MPQLDIPWVSQEDPKTAAYSKNDCGPACISMLLQATGVESTPDQVYRDYYPVWVGKKGKAPAAKIEDDADYLAWIKDGAFITDLSEMGNLNQYGLNLAFDRAPDSTAGIFSSIRKWVDAARPPLALIDYGPVEKANLHWRPLFGAWHYVLVVGYDDENVIVHDPYFKEGGAFRKWPNDVFERAWQGTEKGPKRQALVPRNPVAIQAAAQPQVGEGQQSQPGGGQQPAAAPPGKSKPAGGYTFTHGQLFETFQEVYKEHPEGDGLWVAYAQAGLNYTFTDRKARYDGVDILELPALSMAFRRALLKELGVAAGEEPAPAAAGFTHAQLLHAFQAVYRERDEPANAYLQAIDLAGLGFIRANLQAKYTGAPIGMLPNLPPEVKQALMVKLGLAEGGPPQPPPAEKKAAFTNRELLDAINAIARRRNMAFPERVAALVDASLERISKEPGALYDGPPLLALPGLAPDFKRDLHDLLLGGEAEPAAPKPGTHPAPKPKIDKRFIRGGCGQSDNDSWVYWHELTRGVEIIRQARLQAVKVHTPNFDPNVYAKLTERSDGYGVDFIWARIVDQEIPRNVVTAQDFYKHTIADVKKLYGLGVRCFEVHNEPDHKFEGFGTSWDSAEAFEQWLFDVMTALRSTPDLPDIRLGTPATSRPPGAPAHLDDPFFRVMFSERIRALADFVCMHTYWSQLGVTVGKCIQEVEDFSSAMQELGLPVAVSEFSHNAPLSDVVTPEVKAREIDQFWRGVEARCPNVFTTACYVVTASGRLGEPNNAWPNEAWNKLGDLPAHLAALRQS